MSREEFWNEARKQTVDINCLTVLHTYMSWSWPTVGFGQLSIDLREVDGKYKLIASDECMGRENVRKILHSLADFIADRVYLEDGKEPPKELVYSDIDYSENEEGF